MSKIRVAGIATIFAILLSTTGNSVSAHKGIKENSKVTIIDSDFPDSENEISWRKDRKLSWNDFRGPIPGDVEEQTAAATYCGIGFETNTISTTNKELKINVYNTFYINSSWAKPEEMTNDVLAHEQGHFDLCELYTRKLREHLSTVNVDVSTLKPTLRSVYDRIQAEYKKRQEAYENETAHGVNLPQQRKWEKILERELSASERWSVS